MSRLHVSFSKLGPYTQRLKRILMDGDIFIYTFGFAVEEKIEWPDGTTTIMSDYQLAKSLLDNKIRGLTNSIPPYIAFHLVMTGDEPNWRKAVDPNYKGTRGRKPTDYKRLRQYMREMKHTIETSGGLEADDYLAVEASRSNETAIVSFDKDFFTVPGTFIHLATNSAARLYEIEPAQAICFLMFQALAGDPVDSYKGVDKIGEVKASKMLLLCELKGLTIRQAYLLLKQTIRKREKEFRDVQGRDGGYPAKGLWDQFRTCLDLAALTWDGETQGKGIGLRRIFKYRNEPMTYFLPYYDPLHTHNHTKVKL